MIIHHLLYLQKLITTNYNMKYSIFLFAALMFSFGFRPNETSKDLVYKNTKVILNVDDYICSEDQWVYVHDYKS